MTARWYAIEVSRTAAALRSLDRRFGDGKSDVAALVERCARPAEIGPDLDLWSPRCEVVRRYKPRGQRHETIATSRQPLCPGYVFARFQIDLWSGLRGLNGIIGVLMIDGRPCPVSDASIARLLAKIEEHGGMIRYDDAGEIVPPGQGKRNRYAKGQMLRIAAGPFAHFAGPYVDEAKGEIILDLDILGRSSHVTVPEALVVPA